jgi:hypothetical protein
MIRIVIALIALFLFRCTPDELSLPELQSYIKDEEHGVHQVAEMNGTRIDVTYKPTDLWVQHEIEDEATVTRGQIDTLTGKYKNYYYFIVALSRNNKEALHQTSGMDEYSDLLQTMSFRMNDHVTLTTAKQDTIPVADFMLNRTYGMSNATEILFVFSREKAKDQEWIQFNLNEFGLNVGNQRFRFATKDLDNIPRLKFTTTN